MMAVIIILAALLADSAMGAEVSSVRSSQYEWQCEDSDGNLISGHTRQDKAFQSCINQALATGETYFVRGGEFRVTATGSTAPPPDPDPDPAPDPDPPPTGESPQIAFSATTGIISYPNSISALAQDAFRWELTFTLNDTAGIQGLASRDENGQTDPGHLSIWVDNGRLIARHQGPSGEQSVIEASTPIQAGVEYVAVISVAAGVGFGIMLDGDLEAQAAEAWGTAGNDLPLILGGLCTRCQPDGSVGPDRQINGEVALAIYDAPLVLPVPVVGSVILNWINPTEDEDGEPLEAGVPDKVSVYGSQPRRLVANLDGESIAYEVAPLGGGEHCFVVTAWNAFTQSEDSNEVCKVVQ
jgi:hypothetical protein